MATPCISVRNPREYSSVKAPRRAKFTPAMILCGLWSLRKASIAVEKAREIGGCLRAGAHGGKFHVAHARAGLAAAAGVADGERRQLEPLAQLPACPSQTSTVSPNCCAAPLQFRRCTSRPSKIASVTLRHASRRAGLSAGPANKEQCEVRRLGAVHRGDLLRHDGNQVARPEAEFLVEPTCASGFARRCKGQGACCPSAGKFPWWVPSTAARPRTPNTPVPPRAARRSRNFPSSWRSSRRSAFHRVRRKPRRMDRPSSACARNSASPMNCIGSGRPRKVPKARRMMRSVSARSLSAARRSVAVTRGFVFGMRILKLRMVWLATQELENGVQMRSRRKIAPRAPWRAVSADTRRRQLRAKSRSTRRFAAAVKSGV